MNQKQQQKGHIISKNNTKRASVMLIGRHAISLSPTLLQAFLYVSLTCTCFLLSAHTITMSLLGGKKDPKKRRLKMARNHPKLRLDQPTDTQWRVHKQNTYRTKISSSALRRPHTKIVDKQASRSANPITSLSCAHGLPTWHTRIWASV